MSAPLPVDDAAASQVSPGIDINYAKENGMVVACDHSTFYGFRHYKFDNGDKITYMVTSGKGDEVAFSTNMDTPAVRNEITRYFTSHGDSISAMKAFHAT